MQSMGVVVSLVTGLAVATVRPQSPVCSLLTGSEIEAVTGAKVGNPQPGDDLIASSAANGQMRMCMWPVAGQMGQMTLSTGVLPPGMSATAVAKKNPGMDALRAAKYTAVEKEYENAYCSIMSPPASQKDGLFLTSCAGGVKGKVVSLAYTSPKQKLTLDQVKGLLDKAMGRQR